ncbi:MAG: ATP-dependent RNA helicase [Treponema sp.]|nr:ATP-dependent RNA helicase [Treponema sp.]
MHYIDLPVYKNHQKILSALEHNQVLVVESPTGSGKTTQLPVILHEAGCSRNGIIGVTQPRRIAAVSVSEFIARQMGTAIPGLIGYKMRFEDRTSQQTKIKILTDGMLLQEMKLDPWLSKYSVIIVDEAHERSLTIDFILGLLKRVLESRRDFKVIVSSATINAEVFSAYFGECPVVKIEAQRFPVTLIYDPPLGGTNSPALAGAPASASGEVESPAYEQPRRGRRRDSASRFRGRDDMGGGKNSSESAAEALLVKIEAIISRFIAEKREGDILVFLSGEKMIKECMNRLSLSPAGKFLYLLPLYGRLGKEEQERVFEAAPRGKTKVVVATNIAETSVTIDGITAVIDSGLAKLNWYNPRSFTSSLIEAPVSKASANQRKGRAGRTREGVCYRLYTRRDFENRPLFTTEEIFRTDLSEVILRMAELGITNFEDFDFISVPEKEGLIAGIETLNLLHALEPDRSLSNIGKLMTEFPLAPRQSRIIVEAVLRYPQVLRETVIAAAFLSTQSPYLLPPGEETDARKAHHHFRDDDGDFVSYLKLFSAYADSTNRGKFCERNYIDDRAMAEIVNVAAQLEEILANLKIPVLEGAQNKHSEAVWMDDVTRPSPKESISKIKGGFALANPAGGKVSDYLCCIGRGMIQFVCIREGGRSDSGRSPGRNTSYRSLTADRIIIHPGSVMFRSDPKYIVAGEIVRTSRMYAMSVSPLSREILEELGLGAEDWGLGAEDSPRKARRKDERAEQERKPKRARDFTNNIKIAGEVFEIKTIKGKKTAILPWERLALIRDSIPAETVYKGLKGCVTVRDKETDAFPYTLLAGEKLELILSLAPALDPENALTRECPRKRTFNSGSGKADGLAALLQYMDSLVKPVLWKKGAKEFGFLGLFTDGGGNYWLRSSRGFHTSLNESLASLEALIDEMGGEVDIDSKHTVNQTYRRLAEYIG